MTELAPAARGRFTIVDIARGVAILAMAAYHATWDLGPDFFGFIEVNAATYPPLMVFARAIAGSFLFLAGVSLVLAHRRAFRWQPFLKRLAIIAGAAILVTIVTRLVLPSFYVRFGILHGIAAASVVGALFLRVPPWLTLLAALAAFLAPTLLADPYFNQPAWLWLGLSTSVPAMMDYVPVLPWVGATLLGVGLTRIALTLGLDQRLSREPAGNAISRALVWLGQWSLVIYLVHQPILLGLIFVIALASGHPLPELF